MKKITRILTSLLALAMVLSLALTAFAAASITYEGGAEKFVFLPGSRYTDSDMFENFKDVMPGDVLTQEITVRNNYRGSDYVNIYMRAVAHDEVENPLSPNVAASGETVATMTDFLSQLSMTIWVGNKLIYQASPDELDGLANNVLLGSLRPGEKRTLTVKLEVPIELSNKYQYRVGEVDWVFTAEDRDTHEPPKTGDTMPLNLLFGALAASLSLLIILPISYRFKSRKSR